MTMIPNDDYIPLAKFGKDHWSTFAYAETVMVDNKGFQVGFDGRMRQGRAHYRVMSEQCHEPRRQKHAGHDSAQVMRREHSTRLRNGDQVEGHDDWHCVQDLVNAGLMGTKRHDGIVLPLVDNMEPGVTLHLTTTGERCLIALRVHKSNGGNFGDFVWQPEPVEA